MFAKARYFLFLAVRIATILLSAILEIARIVNAAKTANNNLSQAT